MKHHAKPAVLTAQQADPIALEVACAFDVLNTKMRMDALSLLREEANTAKQTRVTEEVKR